MRRSTLARIASPWPGPRSASRDTASPYEIRLSREAARAYRRLQGPLRERIRTAIDALSLDPRPVGASRLAGRDDFRIRVGDYRIVYAVNDDARMVIVARIAHRRDVYRR